MNDTDFILHDVERGWRRLHHAPKDVRGTMPDYVDTPAHLLCVPSLVPLHKLYLHELADMTEQAIEWWREIVDSHMEDGRNIRDAARKAYAGWPAGPAAHETVVSVVRTYWLACVEETERLPPDGAMLPEDFLLATLERVKHKRAILVLTAMPYWPVGLDEKGSWC
ncbi:MULTISPECIES: hypothetical protein [unclassified Mesorhizobium]|uniref:hypothetical protein n=1 Tax=unclassified Mesorhizobium TaxID=325217 RepID=UPI000FDC07C5|nr:MULTISPECIES: hypothetical protein [unclassified Mesorhizobium]TGT72061.1 hypothetical protein EN809_018140 [Mesorhizobium sp. M2E.F.Ca.ET.166.01.1.1]TGV99225.1 hypothetical protein EN797_023110 [Mesorhizobium sp. M2E.F.Ca.ET.154.01.1.1]